MKPYTSIEQSKKLIEIGIPAESADMHYNNFCPKGLGYSNSFTERLTPYKNAIDNLEVIKKSYGIDEYEGIVAWEILPCWSLDCLLELMPQGVRKYDEQDRSYKNYSINLFRSYYHCCSYSFGPSLNEDNHDNLCCFTGDTWIEAVIKTIIWLKEQKYI